MITIEQPRRVLFKNGLTYEIPLEIGDLDNLAGDILNFLMHKGIIASIKKDNKQIS